MKFDKLPAACHRRPGGKRKRSLKRPFAGEWTANVSKSKRHPLNQFQSATIQFVVVGDTVTIADVVVDASDRRNTAKIRFTPTAESVRPSMVMVISSLPDGLVQNVLETVGKKDGEIVGRGTYEVSADGKTLTVSGAEQLIVLDRK